MTLNEVIDFANDMGAALWRGRELAGLEQLPELESIPHIQPLNARVAMLEFCARCGGPVDVNNDRDCKCVNCGMRKSFCMSSELPRSG